jgi:hypothetical protein
LLVTLPVPPTTADIRFESALMMLCSPCVDTFPAERPDKLAKAALSEAILESTEVAAALAAFAWASALVAAAEAVLACASALVAAALAIWTKETSSALAETSLALTTLIADAACAEIAWASVDVTLPPPPVAASILELRASTML